MQPGPPAPLAVVPARAQTALLPALPASPASADAAGSPDFAHTLQDLFTPADFPLPDPAVMTALPGANPDAAEQPEMQPDASLAIVALQATVPPWPPVGLAGLFAVDVSTTPDADADPAVITSAHAGTVATGSMRTAALATGVAPLMPAAPQASTADAAAAALPLADDGTAALPLPLELSAAHDTAPAPPAFALPSGAGGTPLVMRDAAPVLATPLPPADVHADDLGDRFGAQLQWMAGQKIGHARIQVTPHDLGPVEVRLQMDGDRISAEFFSAHVDTRQALEQGLPRLRDLLGEHGFQLAHAGVGTQSDGGARSGDGNATGTGGKSGDELEAGAPASVIRRATIGLLDAYA
ncbi:flagellar hook-length control protein FliK [Luteimonas yindakuii]|uniref:flagellar hook-length control protein FliK n=1 Tax=Luteimonas yindakuii TaxID=2565782 RepID=UPI0011079B07|nr:flagellar hook-length control protein FliK [Luteimonas yindakuii]QCU72560.1 flagellar hook-length control protein FliK [Luteimonas yindakuii]